MRATGASALEEIVYGVIPQVLPLWISYSLYRFESNVRSASVVGMVGAGGIGVILYEVIRGFEYAQTCAVMLIIIVFVTAIDLAVGAHPQAVHLTMAWRYHNPVAVRFGWDALDAVAGAARRPPRRAGHVSGSARASGLRGATRRRLLGARLRAVIDDIEPNPEVGWFRARYASFWRGTRTASSWRSAAAA